jgi:cytochrome c oxidase cbb3-type subunit 3
MEPHASREIDPVTGVSTTGHSWDGISELNSPLPRWWLWIFYATIVWAIGYWIVYPSWPLVTGYTRGVLGWQSRAAVTQDLAELRALRGAMGARLAATPLDDVATDPELLAFALAQGKAAFGDNCAPCHGAGGGGAKGFPNLNDDEWLFGGKRQDISQTLHHGIRWPADSDTRPGNMPALGRDGMLPRADIANVAEYARSLSGLSAEPHADLAAGARVFADNCAACHGDDGKGNRELGAPNLTDAVWLYGSDAKTIADGIWSGRGGVMPAWGGRLDETTLMALTLYVHSFGGGE